VNARKLNTIAIVLLVLQPMQPAWAESARTSVRQGNRLYAQGNFNEAIGNYDQALLEKPQAHEPKFNKANSYYRLDDLAEAIDLYKEVAAESKDMKLVTKAKYNIGNCFFQRGLKQRDSDLQKALGDLKTSITHWRQVLDIDPKNEKAAKNIEVARLIIKDIIDQINKQKQQQDPNQPQDPNQGQGQQQQQGSQQDPNQPQDPNQSQQQQQAQEDSGQDPNQSQEQQQSQQQQKEQEASAPEATAQEILDKEQQQKKQRQILQRARYQKVDRDW
jgi:Ca-activated chloride channel family protein